MSDLNFWDWVLLRLSVLLSILDNNNLDNLNTLEPAPPNTLYHDQRTNKSDQETGDGDEGPVPWPGNRDFKL